ncbi:MAG: hypothetical protein VX938_12060 [Myxococcota bacterium]|nr:hypothetical protein [Myxococcota bacterium]
MRHLVWAVCLPMMACSTSATESGTVGAVDGGAYVDISGEPTADVTVTPPPPGPPDVEDPPGPPEPPVEEGEVGTPCEEDDDCFSGWCVPSPEGKVCSKTCLDDCPEGF